MTQFSAIDQFLRQVDHVNSGRQARLDNVIRFLECALAGTLYIDFHPDFCDETPGTVCYRCIEFEDFDFDVVYLALLSRGYTRQRAAQMGALFERLQTRQIDGLDLCLG
ncbi:uncharacterized protein LOC62_03G003554 [Vanrija pseudolonga]|uniref:Uncharacterized protein n=1 Tax=Vanrija pseudolonga TaxID=143232 RepID=A0AAF0Y967_9TREE|nr:hypothetical protein LOC62_03G003554 [Vanrija pseudolonga]